MADREGYISGLRKLADLLEQHDEIPLPYDGSSRGYARITFYVLGEEDSADQAAAFARAFPGPLAKVYEDDTFRLLGSLDGLHLEFVTYRSDVCERVVTGTRQVTVTEPIVAGTRKVTKTVEDVEWVCTPLLAEVPR